MVLKIGEFFTRNKSWANALQDENNRGWANNLQGIQFVFFFFLFYFNLYIYPPDSQESDGGAIHRVSNYPDLLPEMPRYCCPLVS